jgi:hypothetical protein
MHRAIPTPASRACRTSSTGRICDLFQLNIQPEAALPELFFRFPFARSRHRRVPVAAAFALWRSLRKYLIDIDFLARSRRLLSLRSGIPMP